VKHPTAKQETGKTGENMAEMFLVKRGYVIIERNYWKKFGEIDIICKKDDKIYFVEVKTVSRNNVSRETRDEYRPEDNLHPQKIKRMGRAIDVYIEERGVQADWDILGVMIVLNKMDKTAKITLLEDFAWQ
jgi:putative endonuclease